MLFKTNLATHAANLLNPLLIGCAVAAFVVGASFGYLQSLRSIPVPVAVASSAVADLQGQLDKTLLENKALTEAASAAQAEAQNRADMLAAEDAQIAAFEKEQAAREATGETSCQDKVDEDLANRLKVVRKKL